jgi:hypothetical protein
MRRTPARVMMALLVIAAATSEAHKPSDSYLTIIEPAQGNMLDAQWDIALRDLEHAIGLDRNRDAAITWGELKRARDVVTTYAFSHLEIEGLARGERALCRPARPELLFDEHIDGGYAVLRFAVACPFRPAQLAVRYDFLFELDPNHRGLLEVRAGGASQAFVLGTHERLTTINLGAADRGSQILAFVEEGVWHIWKGYDHILFLLTLLLPAVVVRRDGRWWPRASLHDALIEVLKVVTAFTVAHSLTLSLAVHGIVALPSQLVEAAIALTVLLGALNNLFPIVSERRWVVAFAFGLIHGLGFASVLTDLGLRGWSLGLALVGFNLGVELGQLAIVMAFVPLAYGLRQTRFYRQAFMPIGAALISCMAAYWLAIRIVGDLR